MFLSKIGSFENKKGTMKSVLFGNVSFQNCVYNCLWVKILAREGHKRSWALNNLQCSNLAPIYSCNSLESEIRCTRRLEGEVEIKISFKRWWWYQRRVECRHWQSLLSVMPTLCLAQKRYGLQDNSSQKRSSIFVPVLIHLVFDATITWI